MRVRPFLNLATVEPTSRPDLSDRPLFNPSTIPRASLPQSQSRATSGCIFGARHDGAASIEGSNQVERIQSLERPAHWM